MPTLAGGSPEHVQYVRDVTMAGAAEFAYVRLDESEASGVAVQRDRNASFGAANFLDLLAGVCLPNLQRAAVALRSPLGLHRCVFRDGIRVLSPTYFGRLLHDFLLRACCCGQA